MLFRSEHIQCYPKSTLPLSEECALVILHTEHHSDYTALVPLLMLGLLTQHRLHCCILYCCPWLYHCQCYIYIAAPSAYVLFLVLLPNTASALQLPLHLCCCWSFFPTLHLHCNIIPISATEMDTLSSPSSP